MNLTIDPKNTMIQNELRPHQKTALSKRILKMNELVVHCKRKSFDIYIGRPSKWGNPFKVGKDGSREVVIQKYEKWIQNQPELLSALPELSGMVLGCWCAPMPCHGEVLVKLSQKIIN